MNKQTISQTLHALQYADWSDMEEVARLASELCYNSEYMAQTLTQFYPEGWRLDACVDPSGATSYSITLPKQEDHSLICVVNPKLTVALAMAMVRACVVRESVHAKEFETALEAAMEGGSE